VTDTDTLDPALVAEANAQLAAERQAELDKPRRRTRAEVQADRDLLALAKASAAEGLVGVTEIAQRAGTTPGTVHSWRIRGIGFPPPLADLAAGPVWAWADVRAWLAIPRPPGRPRKVAAG
jgi:hypothetical protein